MLVDIFLILFNLSSGRISHLETDWESLPIAQSKYVNKNVTFCRRAEPLIPNQMFFFDGAFFQEQTDRILGN